MINKAIIAFLLISMIVSTAYPYGLISLWYMAWTIFTISYFTYYALSHKSVRNESYKKYTRRKVFLSALCISTFIILSMFALTEIYYNIAFGIYSVLLIGVFARNYYKHKFVIASRNANSLDNKSPNVIILLVVILYIAQSYLPIRINYILHKKEFENCRIEFVDDKLYTNRMQIGYFDIIESYKYKDFIYLRTNEKASKGEYLYFVHIPDVTLLKNVELTIDLSLGDHWYLAHGIIEANRRGVIRRYLGSEKMGTGAE